MLKIGDYVILKKEPYKGTQYIPELDNYFGKLARIVQTKEYDNGSIYYILDITSKCKYFLAFPEQYLICVNDGI